MEGTGRPLDTRRTVIHMRTLLAAITTALLFAGCAYKDADLLGVPTDAAVEQPAAEPATTVAEPTDPTTGRTLLTPGYWLYDPADSEPCSSLTGSGEIPCGHVVHVCTAYADGELGSRWFPTLYAPCGPDAPTWRTVCRERPANEWAWYGYDPELCATA